MMTTTKKLIKSKEQIRHEIEVGDTNVFWNEPYMAKYCGKIYELEQSDYHGEPVWVLYYDDCHKWTFAESWVEDLPVLEDELFTI